MRLRDSGQLSGPACYKRRLAQVSFFCFAINNLQPTLKARSAYLPTKLPGKILSACVDTGSVLTLINLAHYPAHTFKGFEPLATPDVDVVDVLSNKLLFVGKCAMRLSIVNAKGEVDAYVRFVEGLPMPMIIGLDVFEPLEISITPAALKSPLVSIQSLSGD